MGGSLEIILDGMRLVCESVKIQIHGSSLYVLVPREWLQVLLSRLCGFHLSRMRLCRWWWRWGSVLPPLLVGVDLFLESRRHRYTNWSCIGVVMG